MRIIGIGLVAVDECRMNMSGTDSCWLHGNIPVSCLSVMPIPTDYNE